MVIRWAPCWVGGLLLEGLFHGFAMYDGFPPSYTNRAVERTTSPIRDSNLTWWLRSIFFVLLSKGSCCITASPVLSPNIFIILTLFLYFPCFPLRSPYPISRFDDVVNTTVARHWNRAEYMPHDTPNTYRIRIHLLGSCGGWKSTL